MKKIAPYETPRRLEERLAKYLAEADGKNWREVCQIPQGTDERARYHRMAQGLLFKLTSTDLDGIKALRG